MITKYYNRSGKRASLQVVLKAKDNLQAHYLKTNQTRNAARLKDMPPQEFCNWSGMFTYRMEKKK